MTTSIEIIEFLKNYYRKKPMAGTISILSIIEDHLDKKRTSKANEMLLHFARDSFENHLNSDVAKEICDYLLQIDNNNIDTKILIAEIYVKNRSFSQAQPIISNILHSNPTNKQALILEINLHNRLNHQLEQQSSIKRYLRAFPSATDQRIALSTLQIQSTPLDAFITLTEDPNCQNSNTIFQIAKLLYKIENYDIALRFLQKFRLLEPFIEKDKHLGTRIRFTKPEDIFRLYIDQTEVRAYSEVLHLTPDQYHFQLEDIHGNHFETFTNLKDGWDYEFTCKPQLELKETHFVEKSKYKLKFDILQQHKSIQELLKSNYPAIFSE